MSEYKHLQSVPRMNADGERYYTHYHRKKKIRIYSEPGTPEFDQEYKAAEEGRTLKRGRPTWVYFIQGENSGLIKIGKSDKPDARISDLQAGSPVRLNLIGVVYDRSAGELERNLHKVFANLRRHGEWFEDHPALLAYIAWKTSEKKDAEQSEILLQSDPCNQPVTRKARITAGRL